jgi:hypothetical protein
MTNQQGKQEVDKQKHGSAVLGGQDRKYHQIAQAHSRTCGCQYEAEPGAELTSLDGHEKSFDLNYLVLLGGTLRAILSASLRL